MPPPIRIHPFRPRLLDALPGYDRGKFLQDLGAGLTVGIVALPLAMAFAIASGVKPEQGLFTAIIAGFLISALGGSQVQIGGPAGAFIVIVYGIVERYGLANLLIATSLAGLLLFAMGLLRLGALVRYIPVSIVIGFTNGIAVLIGLSQLKDLLGLQTPKMPADFFSQIDLLWAHRASFNPVAFLVGLACLALPDFSWATAKQLVIPTITIALLGAIESLLCAWVADNMTRQHARHGPNQELMAQGIANFVTPFFGGIPATGTVARTVTNVRAGAATPVAGIVHALALLACGFFIWRMSQLFSIHPQQAAEGELPPGVVVFELFGSLFFGAVGKVEALPAQLPAGTRCLVLEMHRLISVDTSGIDALQQLHRTLQRQDIGLVLANVNAQPLGLIRRSGFEAELGTEQIVPTLADMLGEGRPASALAPAVMPP